MIILTTAGALHITENVVDSNLLSVTAYDKASIDALADGIELVAGGARPRIVTSVSPLEFRVAVSRNDLAAYIDHEILNYINYSNFNAASDEALGHGWRVVHE